LQEHYQDEEAGLYYNQYRHYDPDGVRYISADPIGLLGETNAFQYEPNPTGWTDPLGLGSKNEKAVRLTSTLRWTAQGV
jgi:RHS repeat-associated protein